MWSTETPWLMVIICSIPAAVLLSLGLQRGSGKMGAAGILFVLLAGAAIAVDAYVETDRERVERYVEEVVRAFERGDGDAMLHHFSQRALCERLLAKFALETVTVEHPLSLKDIQVSLQNEDSIAVSTFRANGTVAVRGRSVGHQPSQWQAHWRKEAGDWKLYRIQELDPLKSEPINRLGQIGAQLCP